MFREIPSRSSTMRDFIYLFLIDLCNLNKEIGKYSDYVKREPGYSTTLLKAYSIAFSNNTCKRGQMSEKLIKDIHKHAMLHKTDAHPGKYKTHSTRIPIYPNLYDTNQSFARYNLTIEGFKEFIQQWIVLPSQPIHRIIFRSKEKSKSDYDLYKQDNKVIIKDVTNQNESGTELECKPELIHFILKKYITDLTYDARIQTMVYKRTLLNKNKQPISKDTLMEKEKILKRMEEEMRKIINEFNEKILHTENNDEKIKIIVKYVQLIVQLHPFEDGNVRTAYILLNKLLRDYNLPLAILINPNRFECCSFSEAYEMVKNGQFIFQQFCMNETKGKLLVETNDSVPVLKRLEFSPIQLENDVDHVSEKTIDDFLEKCILPAGLIITENSKLNTAEIKTIPGL